MPRGLPFTIRSKIILPDPNRMRNGCGDELNEGDRLLEEDSKNPP